MFHHKLETTDEQNKYEEKKKQRNQKHQEIINETEGMKEKTERKDTCFYMLVREKCKEERPKFLYEGREKNLRTCYQNKRERGGGEKDDSYGQMVVGIVMGVLIIIHLPLKILPYRYDRMDIS